MMVQEDRKPEWVDPDAKGTFATSVRKGVEGTHDGMPGSTRRADRGPAGPRLRTLTRDQYVQGVRKGDRVVLARAITLIESNAPAHASLAQSVLTDLLPFSGNSIRIGVTGVPGAGKSTFIESLGTHLTAAGHRVAVLAIDPSSSLTRGSVLGDKTRMEKLARDPRCFIRPSPSGGNLGGVARKTRAYNDVGHLTSSSSKFRDLIYFDLAPYDDVTTITEAKLSLYWYYPSTTRTNDTVVGIYRPATGWNKDYVCWNNKASGVAWTNAGGDWYDLNGTSQGTTPFDSVTFTASQVATSQYYEFDVTELVNYYRSTGTNAGFLIKASTESDNYIGFYSLNNATVATRPKLEIKTTIQ